jgi:hypothetical protein
MHAHAVYIWNYLDISISLISQEISPLSIIVPQKMMKSPFVALGSIHEATSPSQVCNAYTWRRRRLGMLKEVRCQTWQAGESNK